MQRYVPPRLPTTPAFLQADSDHARQFSADGIGKGDVSHHAVAEKSIHAMAGAIEELVGDDEVERLVLFLQRSTAETETMRSTPSCLKP